MCLFSLSLSQFWVHQRIRFSGRVDWPFFLITSPPYLVCFGNGGKGQQSLRITFFADAMQNCSGKVDVSYRVFRRMALLTNGWETTHTLAEIAVSFPVGYGDALGVHGWPLDVTDLFHSMRGLLIMFCKYLPVLKHAAYSFTSKVVAREEK